jgi:hypothetical protein
MEWTGRHVFAVNFDMEGISSEGGVGRLHDRISQHIADREGIQARILTGTNSIMIEYEFTNWAAVRAFYPSLNLPEKFMVDVARENGTFFIDTEIKFLNPITTRPEFFASMIRAMELAFHIDEFKQDKFEKMYIHRRSNRVTDTNAEVSARRVGGAWDYFYKVSDVEIIIVDRNANTPIWYGIAVGATAVLMGAVYLVAKKVRKRDTIGDGPAKDV